MKKTRTSKDRSGNLKEQVLQTLRENRTQAFTAKQLAKKLQLKGDRYEKPLRDMLDFLIETDEIAMLSNGAYRYNSKTTSRTGVVEWVSPHHAFVVTEGEDDDVWVHASNLNGALDGDTVRVAVSTYRVGRKPAGEVSEIIQRRRDEFVGLIEIARRHAFIIPDNRRMYTDIYVPLDETGKAQDGEKVLVKITQWGDAEQGPEGRVVEVLGRAGEHETEMHAIMAEFGLPFRFPETIEKEADAIQNDIAAEGKSAFTSPT